MSKRYCTQCGGEVVGSTCLRPKCQKYWQDYWKRVIGEKIIDYQAQIDSLQTQASSLELENYQEIKKIEREVKEWENKLENSPFNSEVKEFLQKIEQLKDKFPQRIKLKFQNKGNNCSHRNIYWDSFFKEKKRKTLLFRLWRGWK